MKRSLSVTRNICRAGLVFLALCLSSCDNFAYGPSTDPVGYAPGVELSYSNSTVTVANAQVASANTTTVIVFLRDAHNQAYVSPLPTVALQTTGGTSVGTMSSPTNNGDGSYSATFTALTQGTPTTVQAVVNGHLLTSAAPTLTVVAGFYSLSQSFVTVSANSVSSGSSITATLTVKDNSGNRNTTGGLAVSFSDSGGTSTGAFSAVTDHGDGTYSATFTGGIGGTPTSIGATIQGNAITSALPTVTVTGGIPSTIGVSSGDGLSATAGSSIGSTLVAIVQDTSANPLAGVTVTWAVTSGGGVLSSCTTVSDASGLVHCSFATGPIVGTNTVTATATGIATPATFTETGTVGMANSIAVSTGGGQSATAGSALPANLVAVVKDSNSNVVMGTTVVWAVTGGGGSLNSCTTSTDSSGLVHCALTTGALAGANTVTATAAGVSIPATFTESGTAGSPAAISVVAASNNQSGTAGSALGSSLQALVKDSNSNPVGAGITVTWATSTTGASVTGCSASTTNSSGIALCIPSLGTAAGGNTFTASTAGVATPATFTATGAASSTISSIVWGVAPSLSYVASNSVAMTTFTAVLKDPNGNTITSNNTTTVTASITSGSGSFGGTTTVTAASGVATFSAVTDTTAGTITIQAKENTLNHVIAQASVVVSPAAFSLAQSLVSSLASVTSGSSITVTLTGKDSYGNLNPSGITSVAFTSSSVGGSGTYGTITDAGGGVYTASFTGVTSGSCTLGATINAATVTSAAIPATISVNPSAASQIAFTTQPAVSGTTSTAFVPVVSFEDLNGNATSSSSSVTLAAFTNSGCTGAAPGVLGGTLSVNASGGVATFSGITYTKAQTIYLQATSGTFTSCSSAIAVSAGPTTQYVLTGPATLTAGACSSAYTVQAQDQYGNNSTVSTAKTVNLAGGGSGVFYSDACVTTATSVTMASGTGTQTFYFKDTLVQSVTLSAGATGISPGTFGVAISADSAAILAFTVQPSSTATAGTNFTTQPIVSVEDAYGNPVNSTAAVTLAAYTESTCTTPSSTALGVTTNPVNGVAGVAAFSGVKFTTSGALYLKASATSNGFTSTCSNLVTVSAAAPASLVFSTQPSSSGAPGAVLSTQPSVQVVDGYGNISTTATNSITLTAYSDSVCGTLGFGTLTVTANPNAAVAGVATFAGIQYPLSGNLYLRASSSGLWSACSNAIALTPSAPTQLTVSGGPAILQSCSSVFTATTTDALSNASPVTAATTINLTGAGSGVFYQNSTCTTPITSLSFPIGTSSQNFYFKDSIAETLTFTASATGLTDGALSVTVKQVTQVASGDDVSCAIIGSGVQCWGNNSVGQLGVNTATLQSGSPVIAAGLTTGVTQIALGHLFGCAVVSGAAKCWGSGTSGVLGNGSTANSSAAVQVTGLTSGVTAIGAGASSACAVVSGLVYCWGTNANGELGNGTTVASNTPVQVSGVTGATEVAVGNHMACAIVGGAAECWGINTYGGLGNSTVISSSTPVQVTGLTSGVTAITAGTLSACAVVSGAAQCWGYNGYGELGNNTNANSSFPVQVSGLTSGVTGISMGSGSNSACAIVSGATKCWGQNNFGQLGDNTKTNRLTAVAVSTSSSGVTGVGVGATQACEVINNALQCWGNGLNGQVGSLIALQQLSPVQVSGLTSGVSSIGANGGEGNHSCAVLTSGAVKCWGSNLYGQLGNNSSTNSSTPVQASGLTAGATAVAMGGGHSCAVVSGAAKCWGVNTSGQLGNNSTTNSTTPTAVSTLTSGVTAIAASNNNTCAIMSGAVYCWGPGASGANGNGSNANSLVPVAVQGISGTATSVVLGGVFGCALSSSTVYCWGFNGDGELGIDAPTSQTAAVIPVLSGTATAIAAGTNFACALLDTGSIQCWGLGTSGQLGVNSATSSTTPVSVQNISSGATAISAQGATACAVVSGGARCWGLNGNGQVGNAITTNALLPAQVTGLTNGVTQVGGGLNHSCAIVSGAARCWGLDTSGQAGDGGSTSSSVPVIVSPFQ